MNKLWENEFKEKPPVIREKKHAIFTKKNYLNRSEVEAQRSLERKPSKKKYFNKVGLANYL